MQNIRALVSAILEKVDLLLTSEPARLIGYGAAVVITLAAKVLADRGYVRFEGITFDAALAMAVGAITITVTVVESIRKFVYSPQTYIEDLADEYTQGHYLAHFEQMQLEEMQRVYDARQAKAQEKETITATVGSALPAGSKGQVN